MVLQPSDLEKAQLGLGHSYSRAKVKFNVNRVDNMVIQAIFLLDTLDKDINSFSMRVRCVDDISASIHCFFQDFFCCVINSNIKHHYETLDYNFLILAFYISMYDVMTAL